MTTGAMGQPKTRAGVLRPVTKRRLREAVIAYLFLLPNLISFLVFSAGAIVAVLGLGLVKWNLLSPPRYVGLANYGTMLTDPRFWASFKATLVYAGISMPLQLVVAVLAGLLMNQSIRGMRTVRLALLIPWFCMPVGLGLMWQWLLNSEFGFVNLVLKSINLPTPVWLGLKLALPSMALIGVWHYSGWNGTLILAGLQGIPANLYDAASVDGAGAWQRFQYVTLPLLSPVLFFILIVGSISCLQTFDMVYVMTGGGPGTATYVISLYVYEAAFRFSKMGYAAALATLLFAVTMVLTVIQMRGFGARVEYGE